MRIRPASPSLAWFLRGEDRVRTASRANAKARLVKPGSAIGGVDRPQHAPDEAVKVGDREALALAGIDLREQAFADLGEVLDIALCHVMFPLFDTFGNASGSCVAASAAPMPKRKARLEVSIPASRIS